MELKTSKSIFNKKKFINHAFKKGKKRIVEKIINKSLKQIQKKQKKNSNSIVKIAILNMIPAFRIINLTNKIRRKKTIKEIPAFFSNNKSRSSWGLKNIIDISVQEPMQEASHAKYFSKFLFAAKLKNSSITQKTLQQQKSFKERKYFKYYRW